MSLSHCKSKELGTGNGSVADPATVSREDRRRRGRTFGLLALVVVPKPASNLFLTWGVRHFPHALSFHPSQYVLALFNPLVIVGVIVQICWLLGRMTLLSMADLSFVVPVTATGYIISALLGRVFLHEQVTLAQWTGIGLITAGAILVAPTVEHLTKFHSGSHASVATSAFEPETVAKN